MIKKSAGILAYRIKNSVLQVMLVHPGGPFWKQKDEGAWSIPKGEFTEDEEPLAAAIREFKEETGLILKGEFIALQTQRLKSGKLVYAFAVQTDFDVTNIASNTCMIEWPPRSGKQIEIPEVDKAEWFDIETANKKINAAQSGFIKELQQRFTG